MDGLVLIASWIESEGYMLDLTADCFLNEAQYNEKFAKKHLLKDKANYIGSDCSYITNFKEHFIIIKNVS